MPGRRTQSERRTKNDRRRDRRRGSDDRIFVVDLSENEIHSAVLTRGTGGQQDRVDAEVRTWRHESVGLTSDEGVVELGAALREAARALGVSGGEVSLVLGGEFCVTRVVRGLVEQVRSELKQLEQRSRLYLSLGPGPKAVVSHIRDIDARHRHAQALVCNQRTVDAISRATEAAGLQLAGIEASLAAMNRALARRTDLPQTPYLFVNARPSALQIGVLHQGDLLLDYRPGVRLAAEEAPRLITAHLNRLQRHAERQTSGGTDFEEVFLDGEPALVAALAEGFRSTSTLRPKFVDPAETPGTWMFADSAKQHATLAAIGGLIGRLTAIAERNAPDLLEHILERTREPLRPLILRSIAPLAATLLVVCVLSVANGRLARRAATLQNDLDGLATVQTRATELRLESLGAEAKLAQLTNLANQLPGTTGGSLVARIGACLPNDVWMERIDIQDSESVSLRGASYLEAGVYDFVRWLELAPGFAETALRGTTPGSSVAGPLINFEVEIVIGSEALEAPPRKVASRE